MVNKINKTRNKKKDKKKPGLFIFMVRIAFRQCKNSVTVKQIYTNDPTKYGQKPQWRKTP